MLESMAVTRDVKFFMARLDGERSVSGDPNARLFSGLKLLLTRTGLSFGLPRSNSGKDVVMSVPAMGVFSL